MSSSLRVLRKQKFIRSTDISLGAFGQLTPTRAPEKTDTLSTGTAVMQDTQGTSPSAGVLGTFHQSFRPWLGYNVNLGYSRFSENYSHWSAYIPNNAGQVPPSGPPSTPSYYSFHGSVGTNMYELTVAYAVQGPTMKRFSTFAQLGAGALFFLPTPARSLFAEQFRPTMVFGVGMNYKLSEHFAVRAEYRGLFNKNPTFKNSDIRKIFTVTNEPTISVVYTFGHKKKKRSGRLY